MQKIAGVENAVVFGVKVGSRVKSEIDWTVEQKEGEWGKWGGEVWKGKWSAK